MAETLVDVELLAPTDAAGKVKFKDQPFGIVCGTRRGSTYIRKVLHFIQPSDVLVYIATSKVVAGSPAEGAGVRANDVVVAYSGDKDFMASFATKGGEHYNAGKNFSVRLRRPAPKGRPKTASPAPDTQEDSRLVVARSLTPTERKRQQRQRDSDDKKDGNKEKNKGRMQAARRNATPEHRRSESLRCRERRANFTEQEWEAEKQRHQTARDSGTDKEKEARRKRDRLRKTGLIGWEGLTTRLAGKEAQKARTQEERIAELTADAAAASPHTAAHLDSTRQPVFKRARIMYLEGRDPSDLINYDGLLPLRPQGEALAPPGDAADPRPELAYDAEGSLEAIWVSGLEGEYHEELLNPPHSLNIAIVNRAMDLMRDFVERNRNQPHYRAWAELEVLPTSPFSMMGLGQNPAPGPPPLRAMDRLPPLPPAARLLSSRFRSVCVVYIGDGGIGHFVVLLTDGRSKEVKVFDSYSSITRTDNAELRHLAAVGATMLRLRSSDDIKLTFPKVPEQNHSLNSCGAFALLLATAVVMGVRTDGLNVINEVLLRRRVHDFLWCQPANGVPELTALLFALEDFGSPPLVRNETGFGTHCAHCNLLPLNYGADGRPELTLGVFELDRLRRGVDEEPAVQGPHPPDKPNDAGLEEELSEQSEDEDPAIAGREVSGVRGPVSAKRKRALTPRPRKNKKWKYEELKVLKRPGVPEEEASCCPWCGAFLFAAEAGSATAVTKEWCCGRGRFVVPPLQSYEFSLYEEGRRIDPRFRNHTRQLNNMLTLAAGGVSGKWLQQPGGTSFVRCEGKIYRRLYDLSWRNQRGHRSSQLCILDPAFRDSEASSMKIAIDVVTAVTDFLFQSNKLYEEYKRLDTIVGIPSARVVFKTVSRGKDGNILGDAARGPQQNLFPTFDEVSAILVTEDEVQPREVAVWKQGQASSTLMSHLDPKYEALAFPLLRPFAEAGWHIDFRSTTGQRVTHLQYQRQLFLTQPRMWELDRLGQEAALDAVSRIQESRLMWVRTHQDELRLGSREEIARIGEDDDALDAGHRIVLPASFTGSPRYMQNLYEDAMAIVGRYGKPTFFLTVTTNPNWPELNPATKDETPKRPQKKDSRGRLPRRSRPNKGPGLISRIFELKLRQLIRDIRSGELFDSKCRYLISTVEYQKRGLPHAHLLFKLEKHLPVADVGRFIKTHVPGNDEPELREQVLKHQIHGPCSGPSFITNCPCLDKKTRRCTKNFPKPANEVPHTDQRGYPLVPPLQSYEFSLYEEGRRIDPRFRNHTRQLNNMLTLAAGGVSGKWLQQPGGTSFVRCEGKIYRRLYDLSWRNQRGHRSSQLCILDPAFRDSEASSMKIAIDVVTAVTDFLFQSNKLYEEYKRLDTIVGIPSARVVFKTVSRGKDGNILGDAARGPQQNLFPTFDEVSAILVTEDEVQPREVAVWKQGQASSTLMSHLDPKYEALAFPLLRPFAEAGWHIDFRSTTGQRVTHLQYQRQLFLTQPRMWELDRLGQEAALDAVSRIQESRLMWVRTHQDELRLGSREEIIARIGEDDDALDAGHRIVLPASFTGSPRYMQNLYEDAMAIVGRYGKPTFFLTVTTNPNWPELNPATKDETPKRPQKKDSRGRLPRRSRPNKGPGLISRIFELKLRQLIRDIRSGELFDSKCRYLISTVEYQKRGLPHAHLLFKLEKHLPVADVGRFIKTHVPGNDEPELREQVLKHQIHGPCSGPSFITNCPCLDKKTRRCTKNFPKPANEVPHTDQRGYPHYRRTREEKATVRKAQKDMEVDDRWVVPYSDRILRKFDCHNNLEYASSGLTCKYLFKYTHKGPDKAATVVAEEGARVDECQDFENRRVMGAAEAHSRIYGFDVHCRFPAVKPLSVHLPDQNQIMHKKGQLQAALKKTSKLERYLNRPEGPVFDGLRFQQYYEVFTEHLRPTTDSVPHPDDLHHIAPRKKGELITRIYWVGAARTEQFYLRMLLARFPARSYAELQTVRGKDHGTFQEAAMAHGLCKDNDEFFTALEEAAGFLLGPALRMLYVTMIIGLQGGAPRALWNDERTQKHLTEDFRHRGLSTAAALNQALVHISRLLESNGKCLAQVGLPECDDTSTEVGRELSRWDREEQRAFVELWTPRLNAQQRRVVDSLLAQMPERLSLRIDWPRLSDPQEILDLPPQPFSFTRPASTAKGHKTFFLLAPGGSGKSLTLNFVTSHLRSKGHVVLCAASTGIASLNFPGGMTAHGMFKLPVQEDDGEVGSTLSMRSQRAEMIRKASAIIIDEAANMKRNLIRAVERLLDEVKSPNLRFVVYVGDLCQIPPVVKWGSKADVLQASIRFDERWDSYIKLTLSKNERAARDPDYAAWAASVGKGTAPTTMIADIPYPLTPLPLIKTVKDRAELLEFVYPNLEDPYECSQRAILAGTNAQIDALNEEVLSRLEGPAEVLYSADSLKNLDQEDMYVGTEVLGQLSDVGVPPHRLELKVGAVAIIVRNLNSSQRLCNSTKVIIREILASRRLVMVEIPREGGPGDVVPVPRISFEFSPGGTGMTILRKQFPLRIAYSLTHNKSQGQTLKRVGLDLTEDVFAHGQLYVDVTRVEHRDNIRVLAPDNRIVDGVANVLNVVYRELIDGGSLGEEGVEWVAPEAVELGPDPAVPDPALAQPHDDDDEPEF